MWSQLADARRREDQGWQGADKRRARTEPFEAPGGHIAKGKCGLAGFRSLTEEGALEFEGFFSANYDRTRRILAVILADPLLGEEATQEAFFRAYKRWSRVEQMERPEGWILVVGINHGRDLLRNQGRALPRKGRRPFDEPREGLCGFHLAGCSDRRPPATPATGDRPSVPPRHDSGGSGESDGLCNRDGQEHRLCSPQEFEGPDGRER